MNADYSIRKLNLTDLEEALKLTWNVFCEFEAPEYSDEGIQEFKDFIEYDSMKTKMQHGEFAMWGYYTHNKMVGVLGARQFNHISLLFVDKEHHRKGIARKLLDDAIAFFQATGNKEITVNSSPYAVEIYHKMGFVDTGTEQLLNGIRFTPMKKIIG